jgi:ATP-dependent Lon protease
MYIREVEMISENKKKNKKNIFNVMPLKDLVYFPYMVAPLIVGREDSIAAIETALLNEELIFLVTQKDSQVDDLKASDMYRIGIKGRILQIIKLPNGLVKALIEGVGRAKVLRYNKKDKYFTAKLEDLQDDIEMTDKLEAKKRQLLSLFKNYIKMNEDIPEEILFSLEHLDDVDKISDFVAAYLDIDVKMKQYILQEWRVEKRINRILTILKKENRVLSLKSELDTKVRNKMVQAQRQMYLQEQLRIIQEELGEEEFYSDEVLALRKRVDAVEMSAEAIEKTDEELERLQKIPPMSPEFNVIRTYVEWLCDIPWNKRTEDEKDIKHAIKILDEDHYGLVKPKKRILEYIAVLQRVQKMQGPILCLVGPPGVGKTSLGKSIAHVMGREFIRMSLGGVNDEAEIRGHRRTYIGAMPGKIIQGMKKAGTINPLFLLDEIDKLGNDYRGDPASALLEALDPEQNSTFMDHFLEVEYDLSGVMFILTANNVYDIPDALRDRMEVIELPGYLDYEKEKIAIKHLIPKQIEANGLREDEIQINKDAIREIILNYTMEAGVRSLEREISKICRQVIMEIVSNSNTKRIKIGRNNIIRYLGEPKFQLSKFGTAKEVGVATGLAWTSVGGDILRVEINLLPGKDKVTLTGKLGEVMQESAIIAIAYVRSMYRKFKLERDFADKYEIHIHLPEGAVPKDGPSAGVTLTTALLSALLKIKYPPKIAMTGEITLRGKILPVGGLNEKLLAAKRYGMETVLVPDANRPDIRELDKELKEGMEILFVKDYAQVFEIIFGKKKSA